MASSDSDVSSGSGGKRRRKSRSRSRNRAKNRSRSRSRSGSRSRRRRQSHSRHHSRSRSRSRSPINVAHVSTMTDSGMFRKRRSPRKPKLILQRHLLQNKKKFKNKIPAKATVMWLGSDNPNEKHRNLPQKPFCTGIRQLCRERDPVTKRYIQIPDDGSENDIYDITIYHENPKPRVSKRKIGSAHGSGKSTTKKRGRKRKT